MQGRPQDARAARGKASWTHSGRSESKGLEEGMAMIKDKAAASSDAMEAAQKMA